MDGIYYNQTVTEEELNAMAIDLGCTSFNGFTTVEKFGADELNKITQALVSKGVLLSGDMCRCVKTESGITIKTGTIVFANGAKKTISEEISVDVSNGMVVYALNNVVAGTCTIETAEAFPTDTETDYVPLCEITEDGILNNKREVSKAKVELTANVRPTIMRRTFIIGDRSWGTAFQIDRTAWEQSKWICFRDVFEISMIEMDKAYETSLDELYSVMFCEEGDHILVRLYNGYAYNSTFQEALVLI